MQIDKQQILDLLRQRGDDGSAQQADQELPGKVDTEKDGGLLEKYGINVSDLVSGGGGLGGMLK